MALGEMARTCLYGVRRWATVLAAALCIVCVGLAASATAEGRPLALAPKDHVVHLFAPLQRGPLPTSAQLRRIANRFQLVVATPPRMRRAAATMKHANPRVRLFVYENGTHSTPNDPGFPPSWYLYSQDGERLETRGLQGNFLMNPLSTAPFTSGGFTYRGWTSYLIRTCRLDMVRFVSGCSLDTMGTAPLSPTYNRCNCVPIDPRTGRPFTPARYVRMTGHMAATVHAAISAPVLVNGLGGGRSFYGKDNRLLTRYAQGAQAQEWLAHKTWGQNVNLMLDTQAAGCVVLVDYKARAHVGRERMFSLTTFLLADNGRAYLDFSAGHHQGWEIWSPLYQINLGAPLVTRARVARYLSSGVYQRAFVHGKVIVNPSGSPRVVRFLHPWRTLGGRVVRSVTLNPRGGALLRRP